MRSFATPASHARDIKKQIYVAIPTCETHETEQREINQDTLCEKTNHETVCRTINNETACRTINHETLCRTSHHKTESGAIKNETFRSQSYHETLRLASNRECDLILYDAYENCSVVGGRLENLHYGVNLSHRVVDNERIR